MDEQARKPQFVTLHFETFVRAAKNAPGTGLFRSLIVRDGTGKESDILADGEYSCAYFVSSLLALAKFLPEPCATVDSLERRLVEAGWEKRGADGILAGDIVIWAREAFADGTSNRHAGIAVSPSEAVSTSYITKNVERHHITFGSNPDRFPKRSIESVFRAPAPKNI